MRPGGIFGGGDVPEANYEPTEERQNDEYSCLAAAVSQGVQWTATDAGLWSPQIQDLLRAGFEPMKNKGIRPNDMVRFLNAQRWPIRCSFSLIHLSVPFRHLVLDPGAALVGLLAGNPVGHAVLLTARRPGELFDPAPNAGGWRPPTASDEQRWEAGGRGGLHIRVAGA